MDKLKLKTLQIPADTSIKQAMQKLNDTATKILFVMGENSMLLGTVTDGDIRRGIIRGISLSSSVQEIMSRKFISISADSAHMHKRAREFMHKYLIEHIPVVDSKGIVRDVISWTDCLDSGASHQAETQGPLHTPVIIMAGGKGTRLDPFTKILPKPLIPIGNKPIIEHIMDRFHRNGFNKFIVILNYKKDMIKMYFSENSLPYDISFVEEGDYLGTAGGLSLLKNRFNETFIVTNCDTILEGDYADFFNWHRKMQNVMTIVGSHKEITVPYGVLSMNDGSLNGIDEKPKIDLFVNTGTYVFEPQILQSITEKEHLDMDKLIGKIREKHQDKVGVYPHWGGWFDIGQWDEYRRSLEHIQGQTDDL